MQRDARLNHVDTLALAVVERCICAQACLHLLFIRCVLQELLFHTHAIAVEVFIRLPSMTGRCRTPSSPRLCPLQN